MVAKGIQTFFNYHEYCTITVARRFFNNHIWPTEQGGGAVRLLLEVYVLLFITTGQNKTFHFLFLYNRPDH